MILTDLLSVLWISGINAALNTGLVLSERLVKLLVHRANYVRTKSRSHMGGRARQQFFSTMWTLQIPADEMDKTLSHENSRLQQEVSTLQEQLHASSRILRDLTVDSR